MAFDIFIIEMFSIRKSTTNERTASFYCLISKMANNVIKFWETRVETENAIEDLSSETAAKY